MSFTKTRTDADTYFRPDNHLNANDWRSYTTDERDAAFAQAQREIEVYLYRSLVDPASGATYRDDYAAYEQALFILQHTPRQKSTGIQAVVDLAEDSEDQDKTIPRRGTTLSPQAQRFLGLNRVKMVRG